MTHCLHRHGDIMNERDREDFSADDEKRKGTEPKLTETVINETLNRAAIGARELDEQLKSVFELPEPTISRRLS
jgi:hypothetical protein